MGLDIYLYKYENFRETTRKEKIHHRFDEKLWGEFDYDSLSEEKKEEIRNKIKEHAESLGLDEWGSDEINKHQIEEIHPKYPDHYFKIGYFRSSYNDSGIDRVLGNMGLPKLKDVFNHDEKRDYIFQPDWEKSLKNINSLIEEFSKRGPYRVHDVSPNLFKDPEVNSEKEALDIFIEQLSRKKEDPEMDSYTNIKGEFYLSEPLKVVAMIPGTTNLLGQRPCTYIVTQSDNTWYTQALEIVRDTIQFVLEQKDKEKYYLHWSG